MIVPLAALLLVASSAGAPLAQVVAGCFEVAPPDSESWGWAGAWCWPVGDPYLLDQPLSDAPGYRLLRGLDSGEQGHRGADIGNGRGGGAVRAAANGIVVLVADRGWHRGYGGHIVIAHRLEDGGLIYSVYAHLLGGSIRPRAGDVVDAGERIGRIGRTGRATTEHLHFEIRQPLDPYERWENQPAVDPMTFIASHLPGHHADTSWTQPYVTWAECGGMVSRGDEPAGPLGRRSWWRMIFRAARHRLAVLPADSDSLREALVSIGLLPEDERRDPRGRIEWDELDRDLARLERVGPRTHPPAVNRNTHREACARWLGRSSPPVQAGRSDRSGDPPPTLAQACLATADLSISAESARSPRRSPRR